MFVNDDVLARGSEHNALLVFMHCQRTGGSSLLRWFRCVFDDSEVYSRPTTEGYKPWHELKDFRALDGKRVVAGFSYFLPHEIGRPVVGLSNVRHPFFRIVSLYRYSRAHETHFLHSVARTASFEEFYRHGAKVRGYYFKNLLCRRVGNKPFAADAITAMKKHFGLVGTTYGVDRTSSALAKAYGWDVDPIAHSGAPRDEEHYDAFARSPIYEEIMADNAEDAELFRYVENHARA